MEKVKPCDFKPMKGSLCLPRDFGEALQEAADKNKNDCICPGFIEDLAPLGTLLRLETTRLKALACAIKKAEEDQQLDPGDVSPVRLRLLTHQVGSQILANASEFLKTHNQLLRFDIASQAVASLQAIIRNKLRAMHTDTDTSVEPFFDKNGEKLALHLKKMAEDSFIICYYYYCSKHFESLTAIMFQGSCVEETGGGTPPEVCSTRYIA